MTAFSVRRLFCTLTAVAALTVAALVGRPAASANDIRGQLVCRPLPPAPEAKPLRVGEEVHTGPHERRRVTLPQGYALLLNENTTVQVTAAAPPRVSGVVSIKVVAGTLLVEKTEGSGQPIHVSTPKRECTSKMDSTFAVSVTAAGTGLVVRSGVLSVAGLADLSAGQQLRPGDDKPVPAGDLAASLAWAADLMAPTPLVPPSDYAGGSLVAVDSDGRETKLSLRQFHIDVHVEDGFARTSIDQTYFNRSAERLEGTFYFPLPPDASLSRLAMYVDGNLMDGGMVDRDYGRDVYETTVYRKKDPALLEWVDGSTFKMRVFPLEPRQEKRLILSYVQKLPSQVGRLSYRFPSGHSLNHVGDWSFHARVKNGAAFAWGSPSHTFKASQDGADLTLDGSEKDVKLDRDVVLELTDPAQADAARFGFTVQGGAKYFAVRWRPDLPGQVERKRRDWVILFESSGDRDPLLARAQVEVVRGLMANIGPDDTVSELSVGARVNECTTFMQGASIISRIAANNLERAHLIGALDLGNALTEAEPILKEAKNPYLVHVGGGFPAMGERRTDELLKHLPVGTTYVGVGVGRRWNRAFMKAAAERTGGVFTQINPDEPIAWRTLQLASSLDAPRLLNVCVTDKADRLTFLATADSLAQGEELCAVARLDGAAELPGAVVVRGLLNGKPFERELTVQAPSPQADYLPRLWARLEIDRLLTEDAVKHKDEIVALSKAMYVMTPFTSLLVLENEEMYQQYKVERGRKDHWAMYPCPDKIPIVAEDEDGRPIDPNRPRKPSARQVVQTIPVRSLPAVLGKKMQVFLAEADLNAVQISDTPPLIVDPTIERRARGRPIGDQVLAIRGFDIVTDGRKVLPRAPISLSVRVDGAFNPTNAEAGTLLSGVGTNHDKPARPVPLNQSEDLRQIGSFLGDHPVVWRSAPLTGLGGIGLLPEVKNPSGGTPDVQGQIVDLASFDLANASPAAHAVSQWFSNDGALLYKRVAYTGDDRLFYDLTAYAPGLHTSGADVLAVLEDEAEPGPGAKPGVIDDGARALIDKARRAGWQSLTFPADGEQPAWTISFDGEGRFACDRTLPIGMRERIVCDGATLLHLYPDLGLGARRTVRRAHRLALTQLVPWALPTAEDLARGCDVRLAAAGTVVIEARGAAEAKDDEGKPIPYVQLFLDFADDGRVTERRLREMPSRLPLGRETYAADGAVRVFGADGKELAVRKTTLTAGQAPDLNPDVKDLVILPLPLRTVDQVRKSLKLEKKAYGDLHFDEGLALLAACYGEGNGDEAAKVFQQCFRNRDQRGVGFFVLLAACGQNLDSEHVDVLTDLPHDPLAQYLALYSSPVLRKHASQWAVGGNQWGDGFLQRLALSHALYQRWQNGKAVGGTEAQRQAERDRALDFVHRNKGTALGFALLGLLEDRAHDNETANKDAGPAYRALADAWLLFEDAPGLAYAARYENARCLWKGGDRAEARKRWQALYEKALTDDELPAIDGDFRQALLGEGDESDEWSDLLRKTAARLVDGKRRPAALALAAQCWQLGDGPAADRTLEAALDGVKDEKESITLQEAAVAFYENAGRLPEADARLQSLLKERGQSERAVLWREAAQLAEQRDMPARKLECLEKALDLDYRKPPEVVNLEAVRLEYRELLIEYENLARALAVLKTPAPPDFTARVVRAADRWRDLDDGAPDACEQAARILQLRGDRDLAWDYLTTPVGLRPNEAEPWAHLAATLTQQGDLDLADRAYAAACDAEPTNAQYLWDRAHNLLQAGRLEEAKNFFRRLADGSWQPRFQGVQREARDRLKER